MTFHSTPLPPSRLSALSPDPLQVLKDIFGYPAFRGVQDQAVAGMMAGDDILALMPTGGGKSLCFQVPALALGKMALVVSPLVALMRDQVDGLRLKGVRAAALVSSEQMDVRERTAIETAAATGALDFLYVSPERLSSARFQAMLADVELSLVAIDEAHCVCEWGKDFRPDYLNIPEMLSRLQPAPRIALTASASVPVRDEIRSKLLGPGSKLLLGGFERPNIAIKVVERKDLLAQLSPMLSERRSLGSAIVYCPSRKQTEDLATKLSAMGHDAAAYHAGLTADRRLEIQDAFDSGNITVMVATSAFGMGIDKGDIATVAHVALPDSIEAYYQEIGRAGRDGRPSLAWLAWAPADYGRRVKLATDDSDPANGRRALARLESVMGFLDAPQCRRNAVLARFGEVFASGCGQCDLCLSEFSKIDAVEEFQMLLGLSAMFDRQISAGVLAEALAGSATERVVQSGADADPVYFGSLSQHGVDGARRLVRQAIGLGLLGVDDRSAMLFVTDAGQDALFSTSPILIPDPYVKRMVRRATSGEGIPQWRLALWQALHEVRRNEAARSGRSLHDVMSDASLAHIVASEELPEGITGGLKEALEAALLQHGSRKPLAPVGFDTSLF